MELTSYIDTQIKRKKMSRKALADILGKDASTVSNWLNGVYDIPVDELDNIATAIDEPNSIRLHRLAGVLPKNHEVLSLMEMLFDATPDEINLVGRLTRALLKKENH